MGADRQFAFGQVRFEPRSGEVCRDGRVIKLTPRATAVLCALVESAQQLVTKQELFDRVWGGRAVGDDALTSCIQELRGALSCVALGAAVGKLWSRIFTSSSRSRCSVIARTLVFSSNCPRLALIAPGMRSLRPLRGGTYRLWRRGG